MSSVRAGSTGVLVLVMFGIGGVAPAYASCAQDSGPSGSPIVFVGTAEEERRGFTRFSVTEVWVGPDLAHDVWVLSGQRQPPWPLSMLSAVGSSGDAEFSEGDTYVVGATEDFSTNICTIAEASSEPEELPGRPDGRRDPVPNGAEGADPPIGLLGQAMWLAGLLAIVGSAVGLLRRSRARLHTTKSR